MMIIIDFKYGMMGQIQFIQDPSSHQMKLKNVNLASDWSIISTQSLWHSSVDIMFYPIRYPIYIYISLQQPCCFNPREKSHYNTRQYIEIFIVIVLMLFLMMTPLMTLIFCFKPRHGVIPNDVTWGTQFSFRWRFLRFEAAKVWIQQKTRKVGDGTIGW